MEEINELGGSNKWMYRDPPDLVALGRAALWLGAEPKLVLENFFDQAKKTDPNLREAYLASGDLALDKEDYGLAVKIFSEALKKFSDDPDIHFGLARAYAPSARPLMLKSIAAALTFNTNHVPSLLLLADHAIDAEEYAAAGEMEKGIAEMRRALPGDADGSLHYRLGRWYQKLGREGDAQQAFAETARLKQEKRKSELMRFTLTRQAPPGGDR